jgi:hypothetical protein
LQQVKDQSSGKVFAVMSLVLSILGLFSFIAASVASAGLGNYVTFIFPILFIILGTIFGIIGRKSALRKVAYAGITISLAPYVILILFSTITYVTQL